MKEYRETMRLWLFAPPMLATIASKLNRQYRWAHLVTLVGEERPEWSDPVGGVAWIANEASGDYQGCFGFPSRGHNPVDQADLEKAYRKKHPEWTKTKLRRALEQAARDSAEWTANLGRSCDMHEVRAFLKDLCAAGPVTIVLDDGGLVPVEEGGTRGASLESWRLRSDAAITVEVESGDIERALPPPYWTPVTFRSEGSTRAGDSAPRS